MQPSWDRYIARAEQLATAVPPAEPFLTFYANVLRAQKELWRVLERNRDWQPTGSVQQDLPAFRAGLRPFLTALRSNAPDPIIEDASQLLAAGDPLIETALVANWHTPSDQQFFPKAILQSYAAYLAAHQIAVRDRDLSRTDNRCPFCGGTPQLSVLRPVSETDTGGRALQCATCLSLWPFRRLLCPYCGEEDEPKLPYFWSELFEHVRVDACETCKHYLKSVDLTRLGHAVPLVDEVASGALDLWAIEQGYQKIELNLVGL